MRKFFYVLTIALLTPVGLVAAAVGLWLLTTRGNASVNVQNRSGTTLQHVVITSNGFSGGDLLADGSFGFSATTEINFNFALAFDAHGKLYDVPAHVTCDLGSSLNSLTHGFERFQFCPSGKQVCQGI